MSHCQARLPCRNDASRTAANDRKTSSNVDRYDHVDLLCVLTPKPLTGPPAWTFCIGVARPARGRRHFDSNGLRGH